MLRPYRRAWPGGLGFQPRRREEALKFFRCRIVHQLAEDPLEVGEGVHAVTPDLLDGGVDHRTAPAGFLAA